MRRQQVLQDNAPRYRVLLDEAVLHRPVGGRAAMAAQLDKIMQLERDSKATVQVVPFYAGAHAAQDSNFVLLEFADSDEMPPVVFVESLMTNLYQERKPEIARYRESIEYLRDAALSPRESVQRIREMHDTYTGQP